MFCPNCKSVLKPKAEKCDICGTPVKSEISFSERIEHKKEAKLREEPIITLPTIDKKCAKCGNNTVFVWTQQIAYGDEPDTIFYKCTKCGHTWRSMYTL